MCGSGQVTGFLLSLGAEVTGLDISQKAIEAFRARWPKCQSVCDSILGSKFADNSFDCVVIIGGLHHIHPYVRKAVSEIYRVLKPGGYICFVEPHKGSLPDIFRTYWYKHDKLFMENEASLDIDELKKEFSGRFAVAKERYAGNIAYLLVMNSMIFRIPLWMKSVYAPILLPLESLFEKMMTKGSSCFVISQWRKI
jgi:SAM-dependent methyltransferase